MVIKNQNFLLRVYFIKKSSILDKIKKLKKIPYFNKNTIKIKCYAKKYPKITINS